MDASVPLGRWCREVHLSLLQLRPRLYTQPLSAPGAALTRQQRSRAACWPHVGLSHATKLTGAQWVHATLGRGGGLDRLSDGWYNSQGGAAAFLG